MSSAYDEKNLEARIADLESRLKKQDQKIRIIGVALSLAAASPFDDPLKRFFDAPEFWEVVYEDPGACHNECYRRYKAQLADCNDDDQDCKNRAARETVDCHQGCGDLGDVIFNF